jgi:hypothetical protein
MVVLGVGVAAVVVEPAPSATLFATLAMAFEPTATALAAVDCVLPPTAIASVPVADESASVELAWKYLMPPPLLMLSMAVVLAVTCWFVA